jgi:hypothetical protein
VLTEAISHSKTKDTMRKSCLVGKVSIAAALVYYTNETHKRIKNKLQEGNVNAIENVPHLLQEKLYKKEIQYACAKSIMHGMGRIPLYSIKMFIHWI